MTSYFNGGVRHNIEKFNDLLFDIFAGIFFLNKLLPVVGYYLPGSVFLALFAYLMVLSFCRISAYGKEGRMLKIFLLLSPAVLTCLKYSAGGRMSSIPMYLYGEMQVILYGMIVLSYQCKASEQKIKKLFRFIIINYVITGITTIIGNINYPQASRYLATLGSSDYMYGLYTRNNIGGFSFVYELTLITPLIIYMIKKKRINRVLGVAILVMIATVIVDTEYTTALIFFVISLFTFFLGNLTRVKIVGMFSILATVALSSSNFIAKLFLKLSESIDNNMFSSRFKYIAYTLMGESEIDASISGDRMALYEKSFREFTESSGLGKWNEASVGGHSFVLDAMGNFGILGIIAVIIVFVTIFGLFLKPYKNSDFYGYMVWAYMVAIVLTVLNPKVYYFFFMVVMALFASAMSTNMGEKENEGFMDSK